MTSSGEYQFNPDLGLDAEFAGIEMADAVSRAISVGLAQDTGGELNIDERAIIQDLMAPGFAHYYSLAEQVGELAGQGDIVGAFSLMGGVKNARELIGDDTVVGLLAEIGLNPDTISPDSLA
jgi:hypothetical protein